MSQVDPVARAFPNGATVRPDEELLDALLAQLKDTGRIVYTGEFGAEITTFLPLVSWLHHAGHLRDGQVISYRGMAPYYFFLDPAQLEERDEARRWIPDVERQWPTNSTYTATLKPWHRPPDFRAHYGPRARRFARPTLFIQNKFTVEWENGPINFIPLKYLHLLLTIARDKFQVVFSRPGAVADQQDYSFDHNAPCQYPDLALVKRHRDVLILEEMARQEGRRYNELKLEILAGTHLFFSVQGGSSHILAAFGNALLAIVHRFGEELPHAYTQGPYKYLSPVPPRLIVATNDKEIEEAARMFATIDPERLQAGLATGAGG